MFLLLIVASILWSIGFAALGTLSLRDVIRIRRILRQAGRPHGRAELILDQCRHDLGLRREIRLVESDAIQSPAMAGWLQATVLLPRHWSTRLTPAQLRHVLLHELAHVQRNDIVFVWLAALCQAIHWFNPAVWLAVRQMRGDMEAAADAHALHYLDRQQQIQYGETLLELADSGKAIVPRASAIGITDPHGDLKMRLTRIGQFGIVSRTASWTLTSAFALIATAALLQPRFSAASDTSAVAAARLAVSAPQQTHSAQPSTQNTLRLDPVAFDKFAGYYRYADYRFYQFADFPVVARVYRQGDRFFVQDTGQAPAELVPQSVDEWYGKFAAKAGHKQFIFVMAPDGHAREMVTLRQGHVDDLAPLASQAESDTAASKLRQRVEATSPSPGTEAALRQQLGSWERQQADIAHMPYNTQSDMRETPERFQQRVNHLGSLTGIRFVKVSPQGWDVFNASFAKGALEFSVAPLSPSGQLAGEMYREL